MNRLVAAALLGLAASGAAESRPAAAQAAADQVRTIHMTGFGQAPAEMLEGFGLAFLKDLVEEAPLPKDDANRWDEKRLAAALKGRFAPRHAAVETALFEAIAGDLSADDVAVLLKAGGDRKQSAGLRCVFTTASGPNKLPWMRCGSAHRTRFDPPLRAAVERYVRALNVSITRRPANAALGTAICETADLIAGSFTGNGQSFQFTELRFGIGEGSVRTCPQLRAEERTLWPVSAL